MSSLKKNTVYIDEDCPMCQNYANALQKLGMLDKNGKKTYQHEVDLPGSIDKKRARNELALLDQTTGKIYYGIDSIIYILISKYPFVHSILNFKPIYVVLRQLYFLISYNRRSIALAKKIEWEDPAAPDFHMGYRSGFILLLNVCTFFLAFYNTSVGFWNNNNVLQTCMASIGFLLYLYSIAWLVQSKKAIYYLGHLTVILLAAHLFWCALQILLRWIFDDSIPFLEPISFLLFVGLQSWMHAKRLLLLHLSHVFNLFLIMYWVLYYLVFENNVYTF